MRAWRTAVAASVAVMVLSAACGGGGDDASDDAVTTTAQVGSTDTTEADSGSDFTLPPVAAQETFTLRVGNFYGGLDGSGPSLDVWAPDPADTAKARKVIDGLAYGTVSEPIEVPKLFSDTALRIYPAGATGPKDAFDSTGAISRVLVAAPDGGEEAFVLLYEDRVEVDGQAGMLSQSHNELRSGTKDPAGSSSFLVVANTFDRTVSTSWTVVLDGTCLDPNKVINDDVVPTTPGSHTLEIRDIGSGPCESAPALVPPVTFTAEAGRRTLVLLKGEQLASASLVTLQVGLG